MGPADPRDGPAGGARQDAAMDLAHHGDAEVGPGLVDLAVNVRRDAMPGWLREPIAAALTELA
ncbi:aminotransferase, partial [Micromonospora zhanjiangensis]